MIPRGPERWDIFTSRGDFNLLRILLQNFKRGKRGKCYLTARFSFSRSKVRSDFFAGTRVLSGSVVFSVCRWSTFCFSGNYITSVMKWRSAGIFASSSSLDPLCLCWDFGSVFGGFLFSSLSLKSETHFLHRKTVRTKNVCELRTLLFHLNIK